MPTLTVLFNRSNEPPEFSIPQEQILDPIGTVKMALREGAMSSGAPSVTIVIPLAGGMFCVVETSWALFNIAAEGFKARLKIWEENPL